MVDWDAAEDGDVVRLLYEEYGCRIRAFCRRRLGDHVDVDDAVQDTFLRAQRGLPRFDRDAPFWPWLVTIAAHACTDVQRLRQQHPPPQSVLPSVVAQPDEQAARRTRIAIVDEALRSMPARYRTSIYLRDFEGSSYEDIAQRQGTSVASVRSVLLRGRRQLGDRIKAVAQLERQWPLPSSVTMAVQRARERLRTLVHDVGRAVQGAVGFLESAASLGAYLANGPAAVLAAGALSLLAGDAVSAPPVPTDVDAARSRDPTDRPPLPVVELGTQRTVLTVGPAGRSPSWTAEPPFFSVGTPSPPVTTGGPVPPAGAGFHGDDKGGMTVYVYGLGHELSRLRHDCRGTVESAACGAVRQFLAPVGEQMPEEPGAGAGTRPD